MSRFLALDFDSGGPYIAVGFAKAGHVKLERALILPDAPTFSSGHAVELGKKLKEFLAAERISPAPVLLVLGRDRVVFKTVKHPITPPAEEPMIVKFQAQRDLADNPDDLILDYSPLPVPAGSTERKATVVFLKKDLFNAAKTLCDEAGLKLAGVTPRPFAGPSLVARAQSTGAAPPAESPNAVLAHLNLGDNGGEFAVFRGSTLLFTRTVPPMALASEAALIGEAKRSLAGYNAQAPREPIEALYLSEGHSGAGSWSGRLQQAVALPVYAFDPLAGLAAPEVPANLRGRFAGAVGMLALRSGPGNLPINFVAPRQPRAETSRSKNWAMIGLLLLMVVGAGGFLASYFITAQQTSELESLALDKKNIEAKIKLQQVDTNRLAAVDEFRSRDVNWLDVFYDVTEAYPNIDKMRLKSFDGKIEPPKVEAKKTPGQAVAKAGSTAKKDKDARVKAGELELVLLASDNTLPQRLMEVFAQETKYYAQPDIKTQAAASKTEAQQATLKVNLLGRKPNEYTRKLKAEFPKLKTPVEPPIIEEELP